MKKHIYLPLLVLSTLLAALLVSGCTAPEQKDTAEQGETIQEIPIHLEAGWIAGDIAANEDTAFYLLAREIPMAQEMCAAKLCARARSSGQETVVYEYTSDAGFYLNELEATDGNVFWVRREKGKQTVERLDLATGAVQVIAQYGEPESDILLQSDGKYLTWYCFTDGAASIQGYEIAKGTRFDVAKEVSAAFPLARANVIDGVCAYTVDRAGETVIQVYDLAAQKVLREISLEKGTALFNVVADKERCLYSLLREGTMDQRIFVVEDGKKDVTVVNEDESRYVFSWSYEKGKLLLNERDTNRIVLQNLDSGETQTLTGAGEHLYVLGSTTPSGDYLALDTADESVPILTWIQMA